VPPTELTQTEQRAWDWLLSEKEYSEQDITREGTTQTPDFILPDESYEVKRVYERSDGPPKILTTDTQIERLEESDPLILVFHEDEEQPRMVFRWSERGGQPVDVAVQQVSNQITVTIPDELIEIVDREVAESMYIENRSQAIRMALAGEFKIDGDY